MASTATIFNLIIVLLIPLLIDGIVSIDYKKALSNSLLYYEAQRSGKLPTDQRVAWRGHSALRDGRLAGVNLEGGYYDAGDNVKFGFPMAFTVTLLSWNVVEYGSQLKAKGELHHALAAIKWGTDYFIKAHPRPNLLYAGVGDPEHDHECWERPEDMDTPRTVYEINERRPGSDLAGETAAAFAAASLAFRHVDLKYSYVLLKHAKQLFDFAKNHQGKYSESVPEHAKYYSSSGFQDELLWAAAWLYRASGDHTYKDYLGNSQGTGGTRSMFSWDDKFVGAQILAAKLVLEGKVPKMGNWGGYKDQAEQFLCNCMGKGDNNVFKTKGGLLWFDKWNNLQYTTSASFALTVYADYLSATHQALKCSQSSSLIKPSELIAFARSQVDYILGSNPRGMSYMVGFGQKYPQHVHHRGASIVSIKKDPRHVGCHDGYDKWCHNPHPNPNVLIGAIVGGPDRNDSFVDERTVYECDEPATVTAAPLVGLLARIS